MAVNQQRRAAKLIKARAKAKERRKQRDPQHSSLVPVPIDFRGFSGLDLSKSKIITDAHERFGTRKMSEVLYELIEPLNPDDLEPDRLLRIAKFGAIAWNLALFPEEKRQERFDEAAKALPPDSHMLLMALIVRKLRLFPNDDRGVIGVELRDDGGGEFTLLAMSSISASDKAKLMG